MDDSHDKCGRTSWDVTLIFEDMGSQPSMHLDIMYLKYAAYVAQSALFRDHIA